MPQAWATLLPSAPPVPWRWAFWCHQQCSIFSPGRPLPTPRVLVSQFLPGTSLPCPWDCPQAVPPRSRRSDPCSLPDGFCLLALGWGSLQPQP